LENFSEFRNRNFILFSRALILVDFLGAREGHTTPYTMHALGVWPLVAGVSLSVYFIIATEGQCGGADEPWAVCHGFSCNRISSPEVFKDNTVLVMVQTFWGMSDMVSVLRRALLQYAGVILLQAQLSLTRETLLAIHADFPSVMAVTTGYVTIPLH
jgi:hypothetical protein